MYLGNIKRNESFVNRLRRQLAIGLLEPLANFPQAGGAIVVVDPVIGDTVNEEQGQHFDTLASKGTLLLEMLLNSLIDLRFHNVIAGAADFLPQFEEAALIELDIFKAGRAVDVLDDTAVPISLALT